MKRSLKLEILSNIWGKKGIFNFDNLRDHVLWYSYRKDFAFLGENTLMDRPFTITGSKYISVGSNFHACRGCRLQAWDNFAGGHYTPSIEIGDNVSINMDVDISCINKIVIGDGVQMASNILITDHFHGKIDSSAKNLPPSKRQLYSKGPIINNRK